MKLKNILVVYTTPINKVQKSTLELVKNTIKKYKIKFDVVRREKLNKKLFQNKELITSNYQSGNLDALTYSLNLIFVNRLGVDLTEAERKVIMETFRSYMDQWNDKYNNEEINPWNLNDNQWHSLYIKFDNSNDKEMVRRSIHMLAPLASCGTDKQGKENVIDCKLLIDELKN